MGVPIDHDEDEEDEKMALAILRHLRRRPVRLARPVLIDPWIAGRRLDRDHAIRVMQDLLERGLIQFDVPAGQAPAIDRHGVWLTRRGATWLHEFERARGAPADPLEASSGVISVDELRRLEGLEGAVQRLLDGHGDELEPETAEDLRAQLDTIAAQRRSPRPRRDVMTGAVGAIRWMADKAAGSAVGRVAWEAVRNAAKAVF